METSQVISWLKKNTTDSVIFDVNLLGSSYVVGTVLEFEWCFFWCFVVADSKNLPSLYQRMTQMLVLRSKNGGPKRLGPKELPFFHGVVFDMFAAVRAIRPRK